MKRHAYEINTKFCTHLRHVHSGDCRTVSDNLCRKLPGDEFPAKIAQITDTNLNWVRACSQNFVLVLGMRISFKLIMMLQLTIGMIGPVVLGTQPYISQKYKNKLQTMQNNFVRFILGMGPHTHIGQEELGMVGMISCQDRVMQLKLNHVFKIFHNISPEYLKLHFTRQALSFKNACCVSNSTSQDIQVCCRCAFCI